MLISRRALMTTTTAAVLASALSGPKARAAEFRAAAVLPGSITDRAFNQTVYEGLMKAKDQLGIEVAFSER